MSSRTSSEPLLEISRDLESGTYKGQGGKRPLMQQVSAEVLGTLVMILFGNGVCAQKTVSTDDDCKTAAGGSYLAINLGWALGVFFGIIIADNVSGAHLNPSITLALAINGKFDWKDVPAFITAQFLGAFLAAGIVFVEYYAGLHNFADRCCGGDMYKISSQCNIAGSFTTFPQPYESVWWGLFDQVLGTTLLLLGIMAIGTHRQHQTPSPAPIAKAAAVASLVGVIGMCFGFNTGYAINPARDLGPRLMMSIVGFGSEVFSAFGAWWWVPVIGPVVGANLGILTHWLFIGRYIDSDAGDSEKYTA